MPSQRSFNASNSSTVSSIPVVAIGASAGGLEAFSELLKHLSPATGLAYVYIQHLNTSAESHLSSILGRTTEMIVKEAEHLVKIEANTVYIIPPDKNMEIVDGVLTLMPRWKKVVNGESTEAVQPPHMPVDQFFTSLAERQKEGAIGIILSGMAHDGTLGLKAIKVAGGITIVQDSSAKFQVMPQSAIAEGVVDMILSPAEIAHELEHLSKQAAIFEQTAVAETYAEPDANELTESTSEELQPIIQFLRRTIGVDFSNYKMTTIRRRIIRRMLLYKLDTLKAYLQYLREHPTEPGMLYNDLLINVTSFFRDEETMEFLKTDIIPELIRQKNDRLPLRIWVPGCSTGQEAYSLAMLLLETLDKEEPGITIQIFATDLSENAINRARQGLYSVSEVVNISPKRLQRFFTKHQSMYQINKSVRDMCVFAPHNIFKDPPFSRIDLISCRNLLIYLNTLLQRKALITFHYALNHDGYLLLGKSETVSASSALFRLIDKNYKIFVRKNDRSAGVVVSQVVIDRKDGQEQSRSSSLGLSDGGSPKNQPSKARQTVNELDKIVDQVLLRQFTPASVVVDQELDILQFRGETSLFLEHVSGRASLNLSKMARPALAFEIRNAVRKARKSGQKESRTGIEITVSGRKYMVSIEVVPLNDATEGRLFLILFWEERGLLLDDPASGNGRNSRVKQLEEELATMREDMRAIIEEHEIASEELQSVNEEIVSSNEELQSINEELETSKEEIESTNEELQTINQELQVRNDQLAEAYMYAEAIFSTISEATIVLDKHLRVKSANRAFFQIFKIPEEATIGRLIYELNNRQWDIPRLRELLEEVIQKNVLIQSFEVRHQFPGVGEKVMLIHARRVIEQHRQEAILLAIEDITEQQQVQQLLEERQAWFHTLIDKAPILIWVADSDGGYSFFNKAWLDYTGRSSEQATGQGWMMDIHPEDRSGYIATVITNFGARQPYQAEYRLKRNDGEYRWMMENGQPTFDTDGNFSGYIGTCAEVHVQKSLNQELDSRVQSRTKELTKANSQLLKSNTELAQTAENLQAVLNTSPASIGLLKAVRTPEGELVDFKVIVCNQKFAQMAHLPISNLAGTLATELAPVLWQEDTLNQLRQVHRTGKVAYREQHTQMAGYDHWMGISIDKHDDGVILTGLDITALKQAEIQQDRWIQELAHSQKTMQDLEQMRRYVRERGEFLRATSHDLRGSFGVIQGAAALLNLMDTKEEREQMLSMLNRNLGQVTALLTQLLDYSRLESGQEQVFSQPFDVSYLFKELSTSMEPLAKDRGLWLQVNGPDTLPVTGDMVKVQRIAQNLILNALKYTRQGGVTISWELGEENTGWRFSVSDTGPGLPEEAARQLVDSLNSGSPDANKMELVPKEGSSGEGIGLSIVRQLSNLLEATLTVESNTGQGTLIEVRFAKR
ncbi:CheR family methyltransferase [Spirosoma sp.]|uniref:CheR family methyltransferase n=1 Tax=Spirosoma sp. TaxID=1899569 RepID=UPI002607167D|nr:CheR family methyltransferase [Spirosoma sp.]MCX6215328.1 PAS domain S-box protein [Spirosoma sp.]